MRLTGAGVVVWLTDMSHAGEVLMVDAPSAFLGPYNLMKPALGKYGNLIRFVRREEVSTYFEPSAVPAEFR